MMSRAPEAVAGRIHFALLIRKTGDDVTSQLTTSLNNLATALTLCMKPSITKFAKPVSHLSESNRTPWPVG